MKKHIPNILTMIRFLLVPVFIWIMFYKPVENFVLWGTVIFIFASITDYFDGMLARKFKVISNFGKIMDPLADKFLVVAALVALAAPQLKLIHPAVVIIIVVREVAVTVMRNRQARKNIYIPANNWGKFKTISQMVGIIFSLLYVSIFNVPGAVMGTIIAVFFWIVALITILSGASYFKPVKSRPVKKKD